jgi:hypothetical protein
LRPNTVKVRPTFKDFMERYGLLGYQFTATPTMTKECCANVLTAAALTGWKVGNSKVFLKYYHADALSQKVEFMSNMALRIQTWMRMVMQRRAYRRMAAMVKVEEQAAAAFIADIGAIAMQNYKWQVATLDEDEIRALANRRVSSDGGGGSAVGAAGGEEEDAYQQATASETLPPIPPRTKFAKFGSKAHKKQSVRQAKASVKWIAEQTKLGVITETAGALAKEQLQPWFRGVGYSRANCEAELIGRIVGTFMIRVSESRCGYTLSTIQSSVADSVLVVRHYPIDQTDSKGFILRGSSLKAFDTLPQLISYYHLHPMAIKYPKEMLTEAVGPKVDRSGDDSDDGVEYTEVDFTPRTGGLAPSNGFAGAVAGVLANDQIAAINSQALGDMEARFGVRQDAPAHDYALPPPIALSDGDGHDYAAPGALREGSFKEKESAEADAAPMRARGPKAKQARTPSEKQAFLRTIQAAENRIAEARQENRIAKEKAGNGKPKKVPKKKNWAKQLKPGFNQLPAHIRAGGGVPLRARGGKGTAELAEARMSVDYRELGALQKEVWGTQ